jgi:hypothetical protein
MESSAKDNAESGGTESVADEDRFEAFVVEARRVKAQLIDPNQEWYSNHLFWPFLLFRSAGVITIIFGVTLPAVAAIDESYFAHKDLVLSLMSVTIAALTGLGSFYRWERSWKGRTLSHFAVEVLVAKWELELENARLIVNPSDRLQHAYLATNDLISNFRNVGAAETEEFFSDMQFPQSDHTSRDT